jgi:NAD dependent epimerase/dehydratase
MDRLSGKAVLVTGADGFIGSHLCEALMARGCQVRALAQYNSFNHWGWLEDIDRGKAVEVRAGDVRDPFFCQALVKDIDIIFHLASLIAIPYSYVAPQTYVETNITGTLNICQAALDAGVARVVHTSTSEVYGTARKVPIGEEHPLQPQSPYSASKIGADAMAMSYHHAFALPLTIARPFNTYGPRQSARAVIPTIITQIATGARQLKLGDTRPTRDFTYVEDTCAGLVALAACDASLGKTVNIGSNREISIGETVAMIKEIMGSDIEILEQSERLRPEASEVFRLWCDNSLLRGLTGIEPRVSLRDGLTRSVKWFADPKKLEKYKAEIYNV